jgi:acetylxylan esterase
MNPRCSVVCGLLATVPGLLMAMPARAASLQKVNDWGASGVPSTVSMYIYVPDKLAADPPILVVAHFCGGSADAVFGQARTGGIVGAADQYGFIMVLPQTSNNCWDVGSTKALTHDGGGDTQAVAQMVKYAINQHKGNADRVYVTGDSSGGMMTEALLAVYPDVFKGGSSFAGVPAGCWAVGNPDGSWSGSCAGGTVTHTGAEWGAIVDQMYPNYSGHRPRVQLFHGDADGTIKYPNHTEAIKEWTNVLGLSTNPDSETTVTLGNHQATRQQWKNSCGYVVLDAFTSKGGDHGPSDALFKAEYVIPFLGLDKTDAVDPEIAQCDGETGGSSGTGGGSATGGSSATGGGSATGGAPTTGGVGGTATGGASGRGFGGRSGGSDTGGTVATGGNPETGGVVSTGGTAPQAGGTTASGGVSTGGAMTATGGGVSLTGGSTSTGGNNAGGAASGAGGNTAAGGATTSGGSMGTTSGDHPGLQPPTVNDASSDAGCGCRAAGGRANSSSLGALGALALLAARSFRRRPKTARRRA